MSTKRIVAAAVLCLTPAPNASADPDAYRIFDRARHVLQTQSYPSPIFYRTTVRVSEGDKEEFEHFHGEAFSNSDIRVEGVSDEEQATPHVSRGVNFKIAFSIGWNTGSGGESETVTQDAHRREASPDYLGVPLVSPIYSFGLSSDPTETSKPSETFKLPTIATVRAIGRVYNVSFVGTKPVGGSYTYHLHLEPAIRPERYRIRELWVDAYTYQIVQLQTQGNFTNRPMESVPWLVTFQNVGGSTYIGTEKALEPLTFRHDRTFSAASVSFDDISATSDSPTTLPTMDSHADVNLREPKLKLKGVR